MPARHTDKAKACARAKAHYVANRESRLAAMKAYGLANKEKLAAYKAAWAADNQERLTTKRKEYYAANKAAITKRHRENRDAINKWRREHYADNPVEYLARNRARDMICAAAVPAWADLKKISEIYEKAAAMRAAGENVHVDHIVPLNSERVCGLHCEANLQILPASENLKKHNSFWPDM